MDILIQLKTLLLVIASFFGIYQTNLGEIIDEKESIVAVISGKEYTDTEYKTLKTELKDKITNRNTTKINNVDLDKWREVINLELKKCVLTNVTKLDIDIINQKCL